MHQLVQLTVVLHMNQLAQLIVTLPMCLCKLYSISPLSSTHAGFLPPEAEVKALWHKETDLWHNNEIVASAREKEPLWPKNNPCGRKKEPMKKAVAESNYSPWLACGRKRIHAAEEESLWQKNKTCGRKK